ncbi:uncharacterized protein [Diadema setosum]|uniref:uncharacterized protein n=1 Tax=Diadema setosum TaxID=31175 RepID=UPI003B3B696E
MAAAAVNQPGQGRLYFICVPRSGSTSLLKCLSFFEDSDVWFEPFVICRIVRRQFARNTGRALPTEWDEEHAVDFDRAAAFMQASNKLPSSEGKKFAFSEVKHAIDNSKRQIVIVKDMATSFSNRLQYLPSPASGFKFVFMIRDPYHAISSYRKASVAAFRKLGHYHGNDSDYDVSVDDPYYGSQRTCYEKLREVWLHVRNELDPSPLVIDTEDFLADPKGFLQKICQVGGLPYDDGLLHWDASPDVTMTWKEPGGIPGMMTNSLSDFHLTAATSSHIHPRKVRKPRPDRASLTEDVLSVVDRGMPFYEELYKHRFIP